MASENFELDLNAFSPEKKKLMEPSKVTERLWSDISRITLRGFGWTYPNSTTGFPFKTNSKPHEMGLEAIEFSVKTSLPGNFFRFKALDPEQDITGTLRFVKHNPFGPLSVNELLTGIVDNSPKSKELLTRTLVVLFYDLLVTQEIVRPVHTPADLHLAKYYLGLESLLPNFYSTTQMEEAAIEVYTTQKRFDQYVLAEYASGLISIIRIRYPGGYRKLREKILDLASQGQIGSISPEEADRDLDKFLIQD